MFGKVVVIFSSIILAIAILIISIFRGAGIRYAFSPAVPSPDPDVEQAEEIDIDYNLPYPGKIIPDNPLWYIKATRDKIFHLTTFSSAKKAELNLLYADKRLQMALMLFEKGKPDLGYETLEKSQMYLFQALGFSDAKLDNSDFFEKHAKASLKHREVIEGKILPLAPEDIKPQIIKTMNTTIDSYNKSRDTLRSQGKEFPINPFDSE